MTSSNNATIGPFNWIIPVTSICSITVIALYTLPRQQYFGLFIVIWWATAVLISLNNSFLSEPTEWSDGDWFGITLLSTWPFLVLGSISLMFRKFQSIRKCIFEIPTWTLILLQVNRLSGASVIYQYKVGGHLPKYIGVQTSILDIFIATSAIPLGLLVRRKGLHTTYVREWTWLWHSIGLFDMMSAFGMRIMNYFGVGGEWISQPPVSMLGFHPFALIILFQQTLAMGIHLFFILNTEVCIEVNQRQFLRLPVVVPRRI